MDDNSPSPAKQWLDILHEHGYRLTASRRAVIETMANSQRMLNPAQIYEKARKVCASLGLVTVYRTLAQLEQLKLVQRVHLTDGCHAYIATVPGHHHLLICQGCGRVENFTGDKMEALIERVSSESGYFINDHWLQFFGLCTACREEQH